HTLGAPGSKRRERSATDNDFLRSATAPAAAEVTLVALDVRTVTVLPAAVVMVMVEPLIEAMVPASPPPGPPVPGPRNAPPSDPAPWPAVPRAWDLEPPTLMAMTAATAM